MLVIGYHLWGRVLLGAWLSINDLRLKSKISQLPRSTSCKNSGLKFANLRSA
jgi:hypothetical protein